MPCDIFRFTPEHRGGQSRYINTTLGGFCGFDTDGRVLSWFRPKTQERDSTSCGIIDQMVEEKVQSNFSEGKTDPFRLPVPTCPEEGGCLQQEEKEKPPCSSITGAFECSEIVNEEKILDESCLEAEEQHLQPARQRYLCPLYTKGQAATHFTLSFLFSA